MRDHWQDNPVENASFNSNGDFFVDSFQYEKLAPYEVTLSSIRSESDKKAIINQQYVSANGNYCVRISVSQKSEQLLCSADQKNWFQVKQF
jgi:hypothetical protein